MADQGRWQREVENLSYLNHQLRRELEDTRQALQDATKDAQTARDESADLKHKIEAFWDSIEDARATFVRSFPNYGSYRDSHKRSRETDERDRQSRKAQRTDLPTSASASGPPIAPGPPRDARRSRHDYGDGYPPPHDSQYRLPRGQPHLTVPAAGPSDHPNGRSPYDTHPPGSLPDPARPHVEGPRGPSISPHLATRIPSHQGHRHAPSDPNAYPHPEAQGYHQGHARRESTDAIPIPRQRRPANAESITRSSPSPSAAPQQALDTFPNRPALPPAGAIIIHPPAAYQVSFTDLQPGIFLDRADFGAEYPPNLDPPQGLQAVRCLFCDKHYSGANARSLWRRHVMGKHDFIMKGQRASTVRNRHIPQPGSLSTNGELAEHAPLSSVPSASPVVQTSRPFESRPPASQRPASPGRNQPNRTSGELESEDDQEPFEHQRHRRDISRSETRKSDAGPNGHGSGTGSPLTHAALENWNKGAGNPGGDVARWQGQGSVPGKPAGQGPAPPNQRDDDERQDDTPEDGADKQREWCLCRRPDSWGEMIRCDKPTCAIQWYHARCVGMDVNQVQALGEWLCEDCSRKTAQRRQEAHRDGPVQEKDRVAPRRPSAETPPQGTKELQSEQKKRDQQEDVDMQPAERDGRPVEADGASNGSDTEPVRSTGSSVPRKINVRRVLSESQSPKPAGEAQAEAQSEPPSARPGSTSLPDDVRELEPPDQNRSTGSPARKRGWKGYALVPVPDGDEGSARSGHTAEVVTTPGGTRRTRSGKAYIADDGVSASGSERQHSMETN